MHLICAHTNVERKSLKSENGNMAHWLYCTVDGASRGDHFHGICHVARRIGSKAVQEELEALGILFENRVQSD
jgi:hypothetical protein